MRRHRLEGQGGVSRACRRVHLVYGMIEVENVGCSCLRFGHRVPVRYGERCFDANNVRPFLTIQSGGGLSHHIVSHPSDRLLSGERSVPAYSRVGIGCHPEWVLYTKRLLQFRRVSTGLELSGLLERIGKSTAAPPRLLDRSSSQSLMSLQQILHQLADFARSPGVPRSPFDYNDEPSSTVRP
ncbi:hypothetical protein J6590_066449 [Homalodisca vitripennis]|nr:hypothetical protein J6590_066449 [Homalodisca vitripennis]